MDDWEKFFGKFNGPIALTLLVIINEPPNADERFRWSGRIKSKTTQKKVMLETKGTDQIQIESWANFLVTTNNSSPVMEEIGNRRFIYFETDDTNSGNAEYHNEVIKPFQSVKQGKYNRELMELLLHYFRTQVDYKNFDGEKLIRDINAKTQYSYNEQLDRQYHDAGVVERYIIDHADVFEKGTLLNFKAELSLISSISENRIAQTLTKYCTSERLRKTTIAKKYAHVKEGDYTNVAEAAQYRVYTLKSKEQIHDIYNLIEYIQFQTLKEKADEAAEKAAEKAKADENLQAATEPITN